MASSRESSLWRVEVMSLPSSTTVEQLAQIFRLPARCIVIPKVQKYETYHAWINGFGDKQRADEFVLQNSKLIISNKAIKCAVRAPADADVTEPRQPPGQFAATSTFLDQTTGSDFSRYGNHNTQWQYQQQPYQTNPEPRMSNLQVPTQPWEPDYERKLCTFANKGMCRVKDGECKYRHTRCQNYDSCSRSDCALAHAERSSSTRQAAPRSCLNGIKCYKGDCRFEHPSGWSVCADKEQCTVYECISNHPPGRAQKCPDADRCNFKNCKHLHPRASVEECGWGARCRKWHCQKVHPSGRTALCSNRNHCSSTSCPYLHPPSHAMPLPTSMKSTVGLRSMNEQSFEVIELSSVQLNFLEFYGDNILNTIRHEPGITEVKIKDGQLQLAGKSQTIRAIRSYLRETLHEDNVTISYNLKKYLETKNQRSLWKQFLQRYSLGAFFPAVSADTPTNAGVRDIDEPEDYDDAKSDISDTFSTISIHSRKMTPRSIRVPKFIRVSLCSDSEDLLSKAIDELRNYALYNESWALTQDETRFILTRPRKEGIAGQKTTQMRQWHWQIHQYLLDLARSAGSSIVQIFVNYNIGIWRVTVRGFKVHVNNAVSKIKSHLNDHVETEVQLPISKAMAVFLKTKASTDIRQLEKTHRIKITNSSSAARIHRIDKREDDDHDHDCLKLSGAMSRINAAKASVEDFLESLSEQEKHFACDRWDISKNIGDIICMRLKKLLHSADCEAIGWIKVYTAAERRNSQPKITITIVGLDEEAVENVVEQCQDIVDGYVIWKPSTEEYRTIVNVLLTKKSPSIHEFKSQWDTDIRLDRDMCSVIIPARSKMIADQITEALLSLEEEKQMKVNRICEFILVPSTIRRFVNQTIGPLLNEAQSNKIFIELKNPKGLAVHGQKESVIELKKKIDVMINNIQRDIVTRRLQFSSVESDFLRANTYEFAKRIERETRTNIHNAKDDTINDNATSSSLASVINARHQSIVVEKGDITKATNIDAIVNAANGSLEHAGGVDKIIANAAGPALEIECKQLIAKNNGLPIHAGQAVKTTAGKLPFQCIIHAIGPQYTDGSQQERPLLFSSVMKSLQLAENEGCRSVAMPAISSKTYGFPLADCTSLVVCAAKQFFADYPQSKVRSIHLMDIDDAVCSSFARELAMDHRNVAAANAEDTTVCELPPLTAKWCWQDDDGEKIYIDNDMRHIESAFQQYLRNFTANQSTIEADNLKTGSIVKYHIHFDPNLQQVLQSNPNALNDRLGCGYQMRANTGYRRTITRYPVAVVPVQKQTRPVPYQPKPLDAYCAQMITADEFWDIRGMSKAAVEQAEKAIRVAIQSATVAEPFSVNLSRDFDDHKEALTQIAIQQHIQIDFAQDCSKQLSMTLKGFKANVSEAKMFMALYAQDVLKKQVENDDELRTPSEWGEQKEDCKLVSIPSSNPTYVRIVNRMKETLSNINVEKIERVQNVRMWNHYAFRRRELKKELRLMPSLQIEMELFHGTRNTPPNEVYHGEYGFDMTFSTSGMWGIGTYFAQNASYSCGGYAHTLPSGKKQVFFAQVLTGDVHDCPSDPTLRRPPKKNETVSGLRYNSISGTTGDSKVYIIYENRVAYPTYLITFT